MADWEQMARVEEIPPGGRKLVVVDDLPALLIRIGEDFYCIEDTCTHDGAPMTDGAIVGCEIVCPRHGARFDIPTGRVTRMPATEPIRTFPVEVRDGAVYVRPE
jgi:3-phenylpropionate/trans-cinnamate dioxygenase ferredoxin subunit